MSEPQATELTVVRHGETVWNALGRQQGHLNSDLTELGIAQARAVAEALSGECFDALYSSDLGRAVQTAVVIAERLGLEIVTDVRLRERNLGVMQGLTMEQFQQRCPREYELFRQGNPDYCIPEGESARQRCERAVACGDELARRHAGQRVLIVTHGGVLQSFFRHTMGMDLAAPRCFSLFNASVNAFSVGEGGWTLNVWGDVRHLRRLGTMDDW